MPVYNVTIDDSSPLVQYDQWWSDSSHADSLWGDYTDGTFHATEQYGATATVTFNGSAVYVFGAKRPNHDVYAVTLDGTTTTANGFPGSSSANLFNQTLFSQTGLDGSKQHQLSLQNKFSTSTPSYVDLDYIIITTGDGDDTTQSTDTIWDDDHATYSIGWQTSPNGLESNYYNKTMHRTNLVNASATVTFTGNAISVYGATSTNHGFFSVSLDGADPLVLNGTTPMDNGVRYQNLLYWAGGLTGGQEHNVVITNVDGTWLDLDKFVVSSWPQSKASGSSSGSSPAPTSPGSGGDNGGNNGGGGVATHHSSTGAIVGGVVAGVVVAALVALGLFLFYRRRTRRGLDRIQHARPGETNKDVDMLSDGDEPFTVVEPFTGGAPHERTPLSPATLAAGPHAVSSFGASMTQLYAPSETAVQSEGSDASKYIIPTSPPAAPAATDNPHQDFPPPAYEQATAGSSSRGPLPLPPVPPVQLAPQTPSRKP